MKRKTWISGLAGVAILAALYVFYGGHQTPQGQAPLLSVNSRNFSTLKDNFNSAPRPVRILALLSPT